VAAWPRAATSSGEIIRLRDAEVSAVARGLETVPFDEFAARLPNVFDAIARRRAPILVERNGELFRVAPEGGNPWAGYDPAAVEAAIARTAGSWADLGVDRAVAALYAAREAGSRPPGRP
jgi:hypothetical protein